MRSISADIQLTCVALGVALQTTGNIWGNCQNGRFAQFLNIDFFFLTGIPSVILQRPTFVSPGSLWGSAVSKVGQPTKIPGAFQNLEFNIYGSKIWQFKRSIKFQSRQFCCNCIITISCAVKLTWKGMWGYSIEFEVNCLYNELCCPALFSQGQYYCAVWFLDDIP